jgi:hypothetical protein
MLKCKNCRTSFAVFEFHIGFQQHKFAGKLISLFFCRKFSQLFDWIYNRHPLTVEYEIVVQVHGKSFLIGAHLSLIN